jgi:hypothetical protein
MPIYEARSEQASNAYIPQENVPSVLTNHAKNKIIPERVGTRTRNLGTGEVCSGSRSYLLYARGEIAVHIWKEARNKTK